MCHKSHILWHISYCYKVEVCSTHLHIFKVCSHLRRSWVWFSTRLHMQPQPRRYIRPWCSIMRQSTASCCSMIWRRFRWRRGTLGLSISRLGSWLNQHPYTLRIKSALLTCRECHHPLFHSDIVKLVCMNWLRRPTG